MCTPSVVVMYTSDAVEVRYSDGSRLQMSPCGTSILHHDKPHPGRHPIAGLRRVQLRCRFVTSEFRDKTLQALDFRNRFAERPYLCEELLNRGDVVPLYADIQEIAWCKSIGKSRSEVLPDGGVRIFSGDEFASLSLSPHRRDFTVCYLSKISQEPAKRKSASRIIGRSSGNNSRSLNSSAGSECQEQERTQQIQQDHVKDTGLVTGNRLQNQSGNHSQITNGNQSLNLSGSHSQNLSGNHPQNLSGSQSQNLSGSNPQNLSGNPSLDPNGSQSQIQRKSPTENAHQSANHDNDRHNLAGVTEGQRSHRCTRISTPTNIASDEDPGGGAPSAMFGHRSSSSSENSPVIHEISSISKVSSEGLCTTLDIDVTVEPQELTLEQRSASPVLFCQPGAGDVEQSWRTDSAGQDHSVTGSEVGVAPDEGCVSPACRLLYTWVTRHVSCNECPTSWRHPLKLAEQRIQADKPKENPDSTEVQPPPSIQVTADKSQTVVSSVPLPLPLTCPAQHQHKWAPLNSEEVDVDRFNSGRLRVIMVDGIVYRLIHLSKMKVIEVYPGDGSVFISQGISGQFFSHIIPTSGSLEERTYSIRTLPPRQHSAKYQLEQVLKRASRLLGEALQRDELTHVDKPPCWKVAPAEVIEPLSVTVLEEVYIPGSGRFTAHTNGRVRVMFDDRTFLDMVSDFSKRLTECGHHSEESNGQMPPSMVTALDAELNQENCRLLLPSGKYIHVNKQRPGSYRSYVEQAMEWASWVNSSPWERKQFYEKLKQSANVQGSAAAEIQKIHCFNYILDNTVLRSSSLGQTNATSSIIGNHGNCDLQRVSDPLATPNSINHSAVGAFRPLTNLATQRRSVPQMEGPFTSSSWQPNTAPQPIGSSLTGCGVAINRRTQDMLEGFTSVRHALLQTNRLIQDIDDMLEKKT